ncbi:MAG: threonine synthase [Methylophilaceae bacterium]|jgi:threonine synthase|nr:threonine synthase [Methylophilaceae bacterium]NDF81026.1 threonine synthase [Methylophilaceae bacterium]
MKYISTRGQSKPLSFSEILLGGLAPDGGLYLPESYPQFSAQDLNNMRSMSYAELAFHIISKFVDDIPQDDLKIIINKTYTKDVYAFARSQQKPEDITPILKVKENLYILSLSNGPTLAFKDIAMQLLGNLFEYVLAKDNAEINILGATSGDTGSAAEYAMRGKKGINVFMLSPYQKMSRFQSAQMFSIQDPNIFNLSIKGVFDDCQDIVKAVSNDLDFKKDFKIGAVNSINWGRILAQIVYYFKGYLAVTKNNEEVSFTVPTGNFGNICAGHIARMMGLPIKRLVVATNENNVLDEFFKTGMYKPRDSKNTFHTSSPSMDISKASNFERFIFDLIGRDSKKLNELWKLIDQGGNFDLNQGGIFEKIKDFGFTSSSSTHKERIHFIKEIYNQYKIIIDTHTADGFKAAYEHLDDNVPMIVLETALPIKFEDSILEAINQKPDRPESLMHLEDLPQRFEVLDNQVDQVKTFIRQNV